MDPSPSNQTKQTQQSVDGRGEGPNPRKWAGNWAAKCIFIFLRDLVLCIWVLERDGGLDHQLGGERPLCLLVRWLVIWIKSLGSGAYGAGAGYPRANRKSRVGSSPIGMN